MPSTAADPKCGIELTAEGLKLNQPETAKKQIPMLLVQLPTSKETSA
jgi:hypothetical protein